MGTVEKKKVRLRLPTPYLFLKFVWPFEIDLFDKWGRFNLFCF